MRQQPFAQQRVDRRAHLLTVALVAVGHPRQVQRREQGQRHAGVQSHGTFVERAVVEDQSAVDGRHQRRRVAHHHIVHGRRGLDAFVLLVQDRRLLVGLRRAASAVAPLAQHLGHPGHAQAGVLRQA